MISDRDIDRVARAITDGEPSGALRARVMQALEPRGITARRFSKPVAANGLLAACAIAAAVYLMRPPPGIDLPAAPPATVAALPAAVAGAQPAEIALTSERAPRRAAPDAMSAEERAWQLRRLPALPQAEPLALDPIQPERVSIAPISVDPIVMDPLAVPPVGTRAAGGPGS